MERFTVKNNVEFEGFGIHTGKLSKIIVHPAMNDGGAILFRKNGEYIKASVDNVIDVKFATVLGNEKERIRTVEHLLSALYGLGITDAVVEIEGEEIPALDGSAIEFVNAIEKIGVENLKKPAKVIKVIKPFKVSGENGSYVEILPSNDTEIECIISYDHPYLNRQEKVISFRKDLYKKEIAPARTYCFYEEIAHLLKSGLGRGGNNRIVVVIGKSGILNKPARFEDEPVRHKILDLIGDLSLSGYKILGKIKAYKSGHALHARFVKEFLESDAYKIIS